MSDGLNTTDLNEMKPVYRRVFMTEDGAAVLKHLRHITIERVPLGTDATEAQLRTLEAQRALVRAIENNAKPEG